MTTVTPTMPELRALADRIDEEELIRRSMGQVRTYMRWAFERGLQEGRAEAAHAGYLLGLQEGRREGGIREHRCPGEVASIDAVFLEDGGECPNCHGKVDVIFVDRAT